MSIIYHWSQSQIDRIAGKTEYSRQWYADCINSVTPAGISHNWDCPHRHEQDAKEHLFEDCAKYCRPQFHVELFKGAVFTTREKNYHDDSDFYAIVWDGEALRYHEYNTTRFGGGGSALADATEENKEAAVDWLQKWLFKEMRRIADLNVSLIKEDKIITVTRGRKVPHGTVGKVIWYGDGRFKRVRVHIENDDGDWWTDARNCDVLNPDQYRKSDDEIHEWAVNKARRIHEKNYGWHIPFAGGAGLVVL